MKNQDQRYFLVYKNQENEVKTYEIGRPDLSESFGNKGELISEEVIESLKQ